MSTPRSSESVVGVDHQTIQQDVARGQDAVISTLGTGLNANQKLIEGSTEALLEGNAQRRRQAAGDAVDLRREPDL